MVKLSTIAILGGIGVLAWFLLTQRPQALLIPPIETLGPGISLGDTWREDIKITPSGTVFTIPEAPGERYFVTRAGGGYLRVPTPTELQLGMSIPQPFREFIEALPTREEFLAGD